MIESLLAITTSLFIACCMVLALNARRINNMKRQIAGLENRMIDVQAESDRCKQKHMDLLRSYTNLQAQTILRNSE